MSDHWIQTYSGRAFDYDALAKGLPVDLNIYDIAHALAGMPRFAAHGRGSYSVAEHSIYVSQRAQELGSPDQRRDLARWGLLHDATEAYMPDMPSPIKLCLPDFMAMEEKIKDSIMDAFELPREFHPLIEEVDKGIRGSEIAWLFTSLKGDDVWADDIYGIEITPWPPAYTRQRFLELFNELEVERYVSGAPYSNV